MFKICKLSIYFVAVLMIQDSKIVLLNIIYIIEHLFIIIMLIVSALLTVAQSCYGGIKISVFFLKMAVSCENKYCNFRTF